MAPTEHEPPPQATPTWLAAQTFEPWQMADLAAPDDAKWAALANPHAVTLRLSKQVLGLSKAELVQKVEERPGIASNLQERLKTSAGFFNGWATALEAADARLLCAAATLAVKSSSAAHAPLSPDTAAGEDLMSLGRAWLRAQEAAEDHFQTRAIAEEGARRVLPDMPDLVRDPRFSQASMDRDELTRLDRRDGGGRAEAYDRWIDQCGAIDRAFNVPELERVSEDAYKALAALSRRVRDTPPRTAREAALKFAILLSAYSDGQGGIDDPKPIIGFLADLERLAEKFP